MASESIAASSAIRASDRCFVGAALVRVTKEQAFRSRRVPAFAAVLALTLTLSIAANGVSRGLTPADRLQVFEKVWKTVDEHYYDPKFGGVNWQDVHQRYLPLVQDAKGDKEFYSLLDHMTSELHDAHTRFNSPEQWANRKKHQGVSVGFRAGWVDGQVVVLEVYAGSPAERAGIVPGMIVTSLSGAPIAERLAKSSKEVLPSSSERLTRLRVLSNLFTAPLEAPLEARFQRADGSVLEAKVAREMLSTAPRVISWHTPGGFGYIRFDEFEHGIVRDFRSALERLHAEPGLILDLRWNRGGDGATLQAIADNFFSRKTLFERRMSRKQVTLSESDGKHTKETRAYAGGKGGRTYTGAVVVLLSAYAASATEVFAAGMQDSGRATIVGTQSCGCVLGITHDRMMKGGGVLEVSEILWFSPKGRKLEGQGIIPDRLAAPTIVSLQQRRDAVLEEGDKTLRELIGTKRAAVVP